MPIRGKTTALATASLGFALIANGVLACNGGTSNQTDSGTTTDAGSDAPPDPTPSLPAESCAPVDPAAPKTFAACSTGSGSFGRWTVDGFGLPAYDYALHQDFDDRAIYPTTDGNTHREHWSQIGNDRINAIFSNDGLLQVFTQDRGPTWLNVVDDDQGWFGGGFSYVDDGSGTPWASAYRWRPIGALTSRRFGANYAEASTTWRGVKVTHRYHAPSGNFPYVIDDVRLESTSGKPVGVRHYETWDVARRQLRGLWLVSGVAAQTVPYSVRSQRDEISGWFDETPAFDASKKTLSVTRTINATGAKQLPAPDAVSDLDAQPGDPFLTQLVGDVAEAWADQKSFFGGGDPKLPDAVKSKAKGALGTTQSGSGQPFAFVIASDVSVPATGAASLRFAYGYQPKSGAVALDTKLTDPTYDSLADSIGKERTRYPYFSADREGPLHREITWLGAQLLGSVGQRDYWGRRVVPQGSAYLYLHGVDGASRDVALFSMPLTYVDPKLAREQLQLLMGMQHGDNGRFTYAFHGHGYLDDAIVHTAPSDLDLFFLTAMTEYLAATGDTSILDESVDYWPRSAGISGSGFDHVQRSVRHLFDMVGTGEHGLVKVGTGDWSDGIVASEAPNRDLAIAKGESVPNTQMAAYILPRAASWVQSRNAALATEMQTKATGFASAVDALWKGAWWPRAWFGSGDFYYADKPQLEAQVWGLIGQRVSGTQRAALLAAIDTQLDAPSPAGPFLAPPPSSDATAGQVWPAINDLLPWGLLEGDSPDEARAYHYLTRDTLYAHALAYPDMWAGIWSSADGMGGKTGTDAPGAAWKSAPTPMEDFPVMNNNATTMPLLALLRVCGITPLPDASGIRIAPHFQGRNYSLVTQLLTLRVEGQHVSGSYVPTVDGPRALQLVLDAPVTAASVNGTAVTVDGTSKTVTLALAGKKGTPIIFDAR